MLLAIHPDNPQMRKIEKAVEILENDGVMIYPTDSTYALGCDIRSGKAVDRICKLKGLDPTKAYLTLICEDISQAASYARQLDKEVFRMMKKNVPGPFTFILHSNNEVPRMFKNKRRTIGVRIPDHKIPIALVEELDRPILSTSLKSEDDIVEYFTDPREIYEEYQKKVDLVIDGGPGNYIPTSIVDCTGEEWEIIRQGAKRLRT